MTTPTSLFRLWITSIGLVTMMAGCSSSRGAGVLAEECPEVNQQSERGIIETFSRGAYQSLVAECLVRIAKREGDIDPKDQEQVDYFRRFQHFVQTGPTTEQILQWQRENPFPRKRK